MTLSLVIPNYNGAEILQANLPRMLEIAQKYQAPVIIIDDHSTDNSVEWLKHSYKDQIILIEKPKNEGFSSTVNLGVAHATTDLVFLLNSDVIPQADALDHILPYFQDSNIFAVGLKDTDDDNQTHGQGVFIMHEGYLLHKGGNGTKDTAGKYRTGWVSGGSGVFRRSIWNELSGLDTIYNPFYFEDVDLGYRSWKAGYTNYFEPRACCKHLHKKGAIKSNYNQDRIRTINIRNQFFFTWLNLTDPNLLQQHLLNLPRHILIAIKNNDQSFLKGLIEAAKKISQVRQSRAGRSSLNKQTDQQLLELIT